jgi:hypothetical protein
VDPILSRIHHHHHLNLPRCFLENRLSISISEKRWRLR